MSTITLRTLNPHNKYMREILLFLGTENLHKKDPTARKIWIQD